jgi:hypothetical protein
MRRWAIFVTFCVAAIASSASAQDAGSADADASTDVCDECEVTIVEQTKRLEQLKEELDALRDRLKNKIRPDVPE